MSAVGGPSYLQDLRGPYPSLRLVPSGGIHPDDVAAYFDAGAEAVALGSRSLTADGDPARLVKVLRGVVDQL
ncbi:MAG: hypothetical protein ACRDPQ_13230 [Nocardioidaceae bacterium]